MAVAALDGLVRHARVDAGLEDFRRLFVALRARDGLGVLGVRVGVVVRVAVLAPGGAVDGRGVQRLVDQEALYGAVLVLERLTQGGRLPVTLQAVVIACCGKPGQQEQYE